MTWTVSALSIRGVKGVLDRAGDFRLKPKDGKPKSIAIFGRNGHGKSGYADAVEYLFSLDGAVEHLGKGGADSEQGGKHAIPHVLAAEKGINPEISVEFTEIETGKRILAKRPVVTGRIDARPPELEAVLAQSPAHRILRQHDLRRFVVEMAPGEKFAEFAKWIGLEGMARLLLHLTTTENTLGDTDVDREISERLKSIVSQTSGAVTAFDKDTIIKWCRAECERHAGEIPPSSSPENIEHLLDVLRSCRETVFLQSKTAEAITLKSQMQKALDVLVGANGRLALVSNAVISALEAERARDEAQSRASQSVFQEIWERARLLLETKELDTCPVCQTPWPDTVAGSADGALVFLRRSLESLSQFKKSETHYQRQRETLKDTLQTIRQSLTNVTELAKALSLESVLNQIHGLDATCSSLVQSRQPLQQLQDPIADFVANCSVLAVESIPLAMSGQAIVCGSATVSEIDVAIRRLELLQESVSRLEILTRQQAEIRNVEMQFKRVADKIRSEAKTVADNAIDALRSDVEKIYKTIHPGGAIPNIFIEIDADKKTLTMRVNFHSKQRKVPPGGYLSESQINTLGLALFLSSVRLFNKDFPFIFLDDIVSSYDADNRARIVDVLAEFMDGFQIFLTSHDERFYAHLKHRLEGSGWLFERISGYDFDRGPRREADNIRPDEIESLLTEGDANLAGNAVRQYMEEWFDRICEKYEVRTIHRRDAREYQRTLADYWQPFAERALGLGGSYGTYLADSLPFQRLKATPLINYYSHYQANPYEWSSLGDVKYVWAEFRAFIKLFNCAGCGKILKFDNSESKLYCTCGKAIFPTNNGAAVSD
ncbi:MAG: hypothetical protein M1132_10595 [Chloroflexi bacterium]|nr:hypothetical protein [Chloroflexota bacterium]